MATLTLIPVLKSHPVSPTLLNLFLYMRSCLFKSPSHGRIKWAVGTVESIVAQPEVDHSCLHPDTLIFQDIEALNFLGLATPFAFSSHDSSTSLQMTALHIPAVPITGHLFLRSLRHCR